MHRTTVIAVLLALGAIACGERRDIAELAAGLEPFDTLRGMNIMELRSGQVRAMRRAISRAPLEGLRERIGDWDVVYAVQGYDGSGDASWPSEEAQILEVEATRELPGEAEAKQAWQDAVTKVRNVTGATPRCIGINGPGFALYVIEFDRGGDWRLALSYAPAVRLPNRETLSPRHAVAVRHFSLRDRYPQRGQPNPDSLPTWTDDTQECKNP